MFEDVFTKLTTNCILQTGLTLNRRMNKIILLSIFLKHFPIQLRVYTDNSFLTLNKHLNDIFIPGKGHTHPPASTEIFQFFFLHSRSETQSKEDS